MVGAALVVSSALIVVVDLLGDFDPPS
jgi:hypothetical protein